MGSRVQVSGLIIEIQFTIHEKKRVHFIETHFDLNSIMFTCYTETALTSH